jgi:hypothetical protein
MIALLAALALVQTAPPAAPAEGPWRMLIQVPYESSQPRYIFWIRSADVGPEGKETGTRLVHTFGFHLDDQGRPRGVDHRTSSLARYDCDANTRQALEVTEIKGDVVTHEAADAAPEDVIPHTSARVVIGVVCGGGVPSVAPAADDVASAWREQQAILARWAAAAAN